MINPLVSICMPAYNIEKYIAETINSIISQTYKNWELIIVDDGSTDNTLSVARKFESEQIKVISQTNKGASASRNNAFLNSSGEFIKFMDADDLLNPEMLENQVHLALKNEDGIISSKWGRFYNDNINTFKLRPEGCWQTLPSLEWLCLSWKSGASMTQAGMFLLPVQIVKKAGLWDETLTTIDDLDFFTRVILNSKKVIFDNSSTLYYRSGNSGSLSTINSDRATDSSFKSIDQSTKYLLNINTGKEASLACANLWQMFVYNMYPEYPHYLAIANNNIKDLNGADLPFHCGGVTKFLVSILGWKLTKQIKHLFK